MNLQPVEDYGTLEKYLKSRNDLAAVRRRVNYANCQWLLDNASRLPKKIKDILAACIKKRHGYQAYMDPIYQHSLAVQDEQCRKLQEQYAAKGITVYCHVGEPKINNIEVKCFTAEEWVDMLNREGEILHACCAEISRVRDILFGVARSERCISPWELCEIVDILKGHSHGKVREPLNKLVELWEIVKDDCKMYTRGYPVDPNELDDAITVLSDATEILSFSKCITESGDDRVYHQKMDRVYQLAQVMPAVRTVFNFFLGANLPEIDGWALCDGDLVYKNALGLSVYRTEERAVYWRNLINKAESENRRGRNRKKLPELVVRPVRVSVERGIIMMDTETATVEKKHAPPPEQLESTPRKRRKRIKK